LPEAPQAVAACLPLMYACGITPGRDTARTWRSWPSMGTKGDQARSSDPRLGPRLVTSSTIDASHRSTHTRSSTRAISAGQRELLLRMAAVPSSAGAAPATRGGASGSRRPGDAWRSVTEGPVGAAHTGGSDVASASGAAYSARTKGCAGSAADAIRPAPTTPSSPPAQPRAALASPRVTAKAARRTRRGSPCPPPFATLNKCGRRPAAVTRTPPTKSAADFRCVRANALLESALRSPGVSDRFESPIQRGRRNGGSSSACHLGRRGTPPGDASWVLAPDLPPRPRADPSKRTTTSRRRLRKRGPPVCPPVSAGFHGCCARASRATRGVSR